MNIAYLQLGFGTEVPDKITLNVYFSGCKNNKRCDRCNCQNKHLHPFTVGEHYKMWYSDIKNILNTQIIEGVVFLGGEPLDQDVIELKDFVRYLKLLNPFLGMYLYTGYEMWEIPSYVCDLGIDDICAGPYIEGNPDSQIWLNINENQNTNERARICGSSSHTMINSSTQCSI